MLSTQSLVEMRARDLDVLDQAVIATDAAGLVVYWNDAAQRLYGWTSAEAIGRPITDLTPARQSHDDAVRIMNALRAGQRWSGEFSVHRKDGRAFLAHVIDAPLHDDNGELIGIVGISTDATPGMRLQQLARALAAAQTPDEVAIAALDALIEASGAAAGTIAVVDRAGACLEMLHATGYAEDVVQRFRTIPLDAPLPIAVAAHDREALFLSSPDALASRFPSLGDISDTRTKHWIALPLVVGDRAVGAVGLSIRTEDDLAAADRDLLLAMSRHLAVALERARLFQAERTARREAEAARAVAEEASRVSGAFLATMSHELRTPLGAIIGYHDLLADGIFGPLNEEQTRHLRRLRNSATHLLGVIDEVLTHSRLQASGENVHVERGQLGPLLESVSDIVSPLAQAKGLALEVQCDRPSAVLETDVQKLKQILVNLGGNAVKYTERGRVDVAASVHGETLRVSVRDTGIGIAADHLERVFEPFWQERAGRNRPSGGTGLGLSVSQSLARLLGGDIRVVSEVGAGSTFTLEIPVIAPADVGVAGVQEDGASPDASQSAALS